MTKFIEKRAKRVEEQGLIQAFEYTFELAWNTIKDTLKPRARRRSAAVVTHSNGFSGVQDGETWRP